jgi:plasmid stabilization system protein ParE
MLRMVVTRQARTEIKEIVTYLAERNAQAAQEFKHSLEESFRTIQQMPLLGRAWISEHPRLQNIRQRALSKPFQKYCLFYMVKSTKVELLHVYHSARDIKSLLEG